MKKRLLVVLLVLVVSLTSLFAANQRLGIGAGLALRAPFGVGAIAEYDFGPARVNLTLGYLRVMDLVNTFHLGIGGEYVFSGVFQNNDLNFGLKMSVGGKLDLGFAKGITTIGIGIPLTFAHYFDSIPIKIYGSGIPGVLIGIVPGPYGGTEASFTAQVELGAMWLF